MARKKKPATLRTGRKFVKALAHVPSPALLEPRGIARPKKQIQLRVEADLFELIEQWRLTQEPEPSLNSTLEQSSLKYPFSLTLQDSQCGAKNNP